MIEAQVAEEFGRMHKLVAMPMGGAVFALSREAKMLGILYVVVSAHEHKKELVVPLPICHMLREHAVTGLRARIVLAQPDGMRMQPVEFTGSVVGDKFVPSSDGLCGGYVALQKRTEGPGVMPVVNFPVGAMKRLGDSRPEWFAGEGA
jgi:hypothetical protein